MPTINEEILSQKFNNYDYAPGIATYGIDGKTGDTGYDGNIIYYTDYDITGSLGDEEHDMQALMQKINANKLPITSSDANTDREYKVGDIFFDRNGIIYKLINIGTGTALNWTAYFDICGKINIGDAFWKYFEFPGNNNRLVLNPNYAGYDIISDVNPLDVSNYINEQAAVNIISKTIDENNNIEMVRLQSIDEIDVEDGKLVVYYKTSDNSYYIESNKPIIINSDLKIDSSNNVNNEYDNYSTVLSSNDTITYFKYLCDKLKYDVVYDDSTNQYKLLIQQKDDGTDILNYLIQRNETVFGKIYTAENEEYLLKLGDLVLHEYDSNNTYYNHLPMYDIMVLNPNIETHDFHIQVSDSSIINVSTYLTTYNDQINKNYSIDVSIQSSQDSAQIISSVLGVSISYINDFKAYNANQLYEEVTDILSSEYYSTSGIYKYVFNTNKIAERNNKKTLILSVYPKINDYNDVVPVTLTLTLPSDNTLNGEYALQFAIERSNTLLRIKNIVLQDVKDAFNATYVDTSVNSIQTYIPLNVNSVAKFSLIHNTEVFINY